MEFTQKRKLESESNVVDFFCKTTKSLRRRLQLVKKVPGLLRAEALNPCIPAATVYPAQRIALRGGFVVRFTAREPERREVKRGYSVKKLVF